MRKIDGEVTVWAEYAQTHLCEKASSGAASFENLSDWRKYSGIIIELVQWPYSVQFSKDAKNREKKSCRRL
jgi:hypothetical protein